MDDETAMAMAVAAGESARADAAPNPWVGCVIVRDGAIVGSGHSGVHGRPHAEVRALQLAAERARGATAYVTLEPCSHHGVTPPCVDAVIAAGISRVVAAVEDPDRRVAGRGIAALRAAGVTVDVGIGAGTARRSLAPYLHHRTTGRAFAVVKTALSIDGRAAAADGTSQWITSETARADAHRLRAESQAVVIGAQTALTDRPTLTARLQPLPPRQPVRVVLDGRGRVPAAGPLADRTLAPTLVITTAAAPPDFTKQWLSAGADVEVLGASVTGPGVDLGAVLRLLAERGVLQAMFEGGPTVHGAIIQAGLADRIVTYVGGVALGASGAPAFAGDGPPSLAAAARWRLASVTALGEHDARLEWERVEWEPAGTEREAS